MADVAQRTRAPVSYTGDMGSIPIVGSKWKKEITALLILLIAVFIILVGGKHALDTAFWHHSSTDELDILK